MQAEMNALKGHFFNQKRQFVLGTTQLSPINNVQIEEIVCPASEQSLVAVI